MGWGLGSCLWAEGLEKELMSVGYQIVEEEERLLMVLSYASRV